MMIGLAEGCFCNGGGEAFMSFSAPVTPAPRLNHCLKTRARSRRGAGIAAGEQHEPQISGLLLR
ncbi:hypothetical protein C5O12_01415 [Akkermansia muciniphila]|jgi:hypothetical protein|nr:hypothetical protein C1O40_01460 [Akkermansia muciniphila]QAA61253.1 hypothetical protein C1O59_01425 [Akkermansia muciniphila]QHV10832.1 hypothetical protein C5N97_01410 [Akkermansia muciniphila]QHV18094.1 hypothetical protein C5O11_01625 [Akkermansia muciniphila]QHV20420.1 hypothetical protein C5O12_01415 [Akkermansia muciniphila]